MGLSNLIRLKLVYLVPNSLYIINLKKNYYIIQIVKSVTYVYIELDPIPNN